MLVLIGVVSYFRSQDTTYVDSDDITIISEDNQDIDTDLNITTEDISETTIPTTFENITVSLPLTEQSISDDDNNVTSTIEYSSSTDQTQSVVNNGSTVSSGKIN